jgi:hypothetical protein
MSTMMAGSSMKVTGFDGSDPKRRVDEEDG